MAPKKPVNTPGNKPGTKPGYAPGKTTGPTTGKKPGHKAVHKLESAPSPETPTGPSAYDLGSRTPGWVTGLASLTVFSVLLIFSQLVLHGLAQARHTSALRALIFSDVPIQQIITDPEIQPQVSSKDALASRLVQLASALDSGAWDREEIQEIQDSVFQTGSLSTSTIAALSLSADELAQSDATLAGLEEELKSVREKRSEASKMYNLVLSDLDALLLKTETPESEDASPEAETADQPMPFYVSGVLAGLPVFSQLPDGLADEGALQAALTEHIGHSTSSRVLRQIMDLPKKDAVQLADLRDMVDKSDQSLAEVKSKIEAANQTRLELTRHARSVSRDILFDLVTPILAEQTVRAYRVATQSTFIPGRNTFPELRAKVRNKAGGFTFL